MAAVKPFIRYCILDAFADSTFKGNPAAVCLLEEERDDEWLQMVAREFNINITCYLTRQISDSSLADSVPRFSLRWFTTVTEVKLCGHGTLAASHFLFSYDMVKSDVIEFSTLSGILTAKKVVLQVSDHSSNYSQNGKINSTDASSHSSLIELDLPLISSKKYDGDVSAVLKSLNGASVSEIHLGYDLLVVLPTGKAVVEANPNFDEIRKCPGRGMIITGLAPPGSVFDFVSRFFGPKIGVNEDPVCGSAHCALAPYWSKKLGKSDFIAYQASSRGGILNLHVDDKNQRVLLRGKAIAVMEGSVLV